MQLKGIVLDAGGKGQPSYKQALLNSTRVTWVVMDIFPVEGVSISGDLTSLPFQGETFDSVICFNVLEHVYDYRTALSEVRRVLKIDGVVYGYVPFICNVHPDPYDYWRFTADCLRRCLNEVGLSLVYVSPHGGVFIACFDLISFIVKKLPPMRVLLAAMLLLADSLLKYVRPSYLEQFPVGYFFLGRKPL